MMKWRISVSRDIDLPDGGGYTDGHEYFYDSLEEAQGAVKLLKAEGWRLDNGPVQALPPENYDTNPPGSTRGRHEFTDIDSVRTATESSYAQWAKLLKTCVPDSDEWHRCNLQLMAAERGIAEAYGFDEVDRLHQKYLGDGTQPRKDEKEMSVKPRQRVTRRR